MEFRYTDKQLNGLNQEQNVYSVNPDLALKKSHKVIVDKAKEKLENYENNEIKIDNQSFRVVSTLNDEATGTQAMAVAPIVNGKPDYHSVAVVAAGTDPSDPYDWAGAGRSWYSKTDSSHQLYVVDTWLYELNQKYTITQLTGYSQSAFMMKLGAKYQIPTTVFNGWFSYDSLTKEEADYIKKNTSSFKNYRKIDDDIVHFFDGNLKDKQDVKGFGTIYWVKGSSHKIFDWEFNDKGELVDENGKVVAKGHKAGYLWLSTASQAFLEYELSSLQALRNQLKADGLSKGEQIYLDSEQASGIAATLEVIATQGLDVLIQIYDQAITDAEELWNNLLRDTYSVAPNLTEVEILHQLGIWNVTRETMVVDVYQRCREKKVIAYELKQDFQDIAQNIQRGIQQQLETDKELAGRFNQWDLMKNSIN